MEKQDHLIKIFEYALNQEQTGLSFFNASIERMGIGSAVTAFKQLVREEQSHIVFITQILDQLRGGDIALAKSAPVPDLPTVDFFDKRAEAEFLEQCVQGSMIPDVTVFNTAWLIEKDLSEFYSNMAKRTDGKAAEALNMLARWELQHERFFKRFRDKLSEQYATMPWGG